MGSYRPAGEGLIGMGAMFELQAYLYEKRICKD
jgi:hypothetical protein